MNSTQKTILETLVRTFGVPIDQQDFFDKTDEEVEQKIKQIEEQLFIDLFENR